MGQTSRAIATTCSPPSADLMLSGVWLLFAPTQLSAVWVLFAPNLAHTGPCADTCRRRCRDVVTSPGARVTCSRRPVWVSAGIVCCFGTIAELIHAAGALSPRRFARP